MKTNPKAVKLLVLIWVFGLLHSAPMRAQVSGATLSGTITDAQGGAVAGAKVSVKNLGTGIAVDTTTNDTGAYGVPNLTPSDYEVSVTAPGFSTTTAKVTLTVGARQEMNIHLTVGQVSQTVEVTGAALQVDLSSSTISGNVVGNEVRELPLNGRDWTALATLEPGVNSIRTQQSPVGNVIQGSRGLGMQLAVSGNRSTQNSYRLDGGIVNDYSNAGPGSVLGSNLGVDAIQEFTVLTSNYSAEYGFTSGGVINAVTRSGTNSFHGTAFDFVRNDKFDAANFFDNANGLKKAVLRQNQFGGSAGAPILKNKVFVFGDYEGVRYVRGLATQNITYSSAVRNNNGNPCPAGIAAPCGTVSDLKSPATLYTVHIDPIIQKFLNLYPLPTPGVPLTNANSGPYNYEGVQRAHEDFVTGRFDFKISSKDSLFGTYVRDTSQLTYPSAFQNNQGLNTSYRQSIIVEETHIFGASFVNSVRAAETRTQSNQRAGAIGVNPVGSDPALLQSPAESLTLYGASSTGTSGTGVTGAAGPSPNQKNNYGLQFGQLYDDAFLTRGNHTVKFGADFFRMWHVALNTNKVGGNGAGTFSGNFTATAAGTAGTFGFPPTQGCPTASCTVSGAGAAILDLLTNRPSQSTAFADYTNAFQRYTRTNIYGAYLQDDWRVRPSLTLNLGIRYEPMGIPQEKYGRVAFLKTIYSPATDVTNQIRSSNVTLKNFEPRIGFSWDPRHDGKMAIRGGFGLFDVLPLNYESSLQMFNFPLFPFATVVGNSFGSPITPGTWPYSIPNLVATQGNASGAAYGYVDANEKNNYVYQYNLNIQRQITPNTTFTVAYVGSHAVHNPKPETTLNSVLPTKIVPGVGEVWPVPWVYCTAADATKGCTGAGVGLSGLLNTKVGMIQSTSWQGMSYYNALQTSVNKKMSHGFQIQGSFTWSKSIDTSSGSFGDTYANSQASTAFYDLRQERGRSDFNVDRNLVINALWTAPNPKGLGAFGDRALGGWQLGSIVSLSDGTPFWLMVGGDSAVGNDMLGEEYYTFNPPEVIPGCSPTQSPKLNIGGPLQYVNLKCFGLVQQTPANIAAGCDTVRAAALAAAAGTTAYDQMGLLHSCPNIRGSMGRNSITGPGLVNFDFSVFKNNYIPKISEAFNIQFRAEMFNLFNRTNFAQPNIGSTVTGLQIINGSGQPVSRAGQILQTQTPGRVIQFALKAIW